MLRIPIGIDPSKVTEFLDYLRLQMQFEAGWRGEGSLLEDGSFEEKVVGKLQGSGPEHGDLVISLTWNPDGTLEPISFNVQGNAPPKWRTVVQDWVHNALIATVNADRERYFFNFQFAYIGAPLDGEYYISGFRVAPAIYPDVGQLLDERIVYIGLHSEGVDREQSSGMGRIQAEHFVSLLSCFISVGFYAIPFERRWVLSGTGDSTRYQLGFKPQAQPPSEMPGKGQLCPLGTPKTVNREELLVPTTESSIQLPADVRELYRRYSALHSGEQEAFLGAASLYRVALTAGRNYPTVRMAYQVAAVDALLRHEPDKQKAFVTLVRSLCPEAPEDVVDEMYGRIRSAHFHSGRFPGGEYEPLEFGPFTGPDQLKRLNYHHAVQAIMWNTLIRWLLSRDKPGT